MPTRKKLGEILIEASVINQETLNRGLAEQRKWGGQLGRVMVDRGLITEDALVKALSQQFRIPVIDVARASVPRAALDAVSVELAQQFCVLPVKLEGKFLDLAMSDPTNLGVIDELRMRTQLDVQPFIAGPRAIEQAIKRWYSATAGYAARTTAASMPAIPQAIGGSGAGAAAAGPGPAWGAATDTDRDQEIRSLQKRVQMLEGLRQRDEDVIRQLCLILIENNIVTREELLKRLGR